MINYIQTRSKASLNSVDIVKNKNKYSITGSEESKWLDDDFIKLTLIVLKNIYLSGVMMCF